MKLFSECIAYRKNLRNEIKIQKKLILVECNASTCSLISSLGFATVNGILALNSTQVSVLQPLKYLF